MSSPNKKRKILTDDNNRKEKTELITLKFLDNQCCTIPHDLFSGARDLPVLNRMFSETNKHMLIKDQDGHVIILTISSIFIPIIYRLLRPSISWSVIPKELTSEEWEAELDYWGYTNETNIPTIQTKDLLDGARETQNQFITMVLTSFLSWALKIYPKFQESIIMRESINIDIGSKVTLDEINPDIKTKFDIESKNFGEWLTSNRRGKLLDEYFKEKLGCEYIVVKKTPLKCTISIIFFK